MYNCCIIDNVLHENDCKDLFKFYVKYEAIKDDALQFNCPDCNKD